jgi:hypothetical protein
MPKRMIVFAATMLVAIAAALSSTRLSHAEHSTTTCVAKPGFDPPAGSHWYYITEQGHHCWFIKMEGAKIAVRQETQPKPLPAPRPAPPVIAEHPLEDAAAEASSKVPEQMAPISMAWTGALETTGSFAGKFALADYPDAKVTNPLPDEVPRTEPVVAETPASSAESLPASAVMLVFAGALLLASLVAGLVRGLSRGGGRA